MNRSGEESRDMVTLRKKDTLKEWVCNAATDGWCADWACVAPETKITSVQHTGGDYDEDAVFLEQKNFLAEAERQATLLSTWAAQEEDVSSGFTHMTVVLYGSAWVGISRMLSPDDVVKVRTCARYWNDGVLCGDLGNYFLLLTMKQYGQSNGVVHSDDGGTSSWITFVSVDFIHLRVNH